MQLIVVLVVGICIALVTSHFAERRGRDRHFWFWMGLLLGVVALIAVFLLPEVKDEPEPASLGASQAAGTITTTGVSAIEGGGAFQTLQSQGWFYMDQDHRQQGPVDLNFLRQLWENKSVIAQTYVWTEGMTAWQFIRDLPHLQKELSK